MSDRCTERHPEVDAICIKRVHDDGRHAALSIDDDVVRWWDDPKPHPGLEQINALIFEEENLIKQTLSAIQGDRSIHSDILRMIVPALERQLKIIKAIAAHIPEVAD